ncbi:MAG: glycosyltransferase family 2 protein [Armatimonadetes bacterium]|nr:MAG: glycosyltransferase family 2 protein [Armatimonadota bacterium]
MLSVIIVNWNTKTHLEKCLSSLQKYAPQEGIEVIVVDNASRDGSAEMVRNSFPDVRLLAEAENWGYAKGNNLGLREATGDFILFLNPDTEFVDESLQRAIETLRQRPEVGVLAARLLNEDGTTQSSLRSFPRSLPILFDWLGLAKLFPRVPFFSRYRYRFYNYDQPGYVEQPMGTFLMTRREVLDQVGDWDESFPIFFNDVDWLWRVHLAGWKVYYEPTVRVVHHGGAGTKQVRKAMIWESHRSLLRYYEKWYVKGWNRPLFALFRWFVLGAAFVRARGFDAGFRR